MSAVYMLPVFFSFSTSMTLLYRNQPFLRMYVIASNLLGHSLVLRDSRGNATSHTRATVLNQSPLVAIWAGSRSSRWDMVSNTLEVRVSALTLRQAH